MPILKSSSAGHDVEKCRGGSDEKYECWNASQILEMIQNAWSAPGAKGAGTVPLRSWNVRRKRRRMWSSHGERLQPKANKTPAVRESRLDAGGLVIAGVVIFWRSGLAQAFSAWGPRPVMFCPPACCPGFRTAKNCPAPESLWPQGLPPTIPSSRCLRRCHTAWPSTFYRMPCRASRSMRAASSSALFSMPLCSQT